MVVWKSKQIQIKSRKSGLSFEDSCIALDNTFQRDSASKTQQLSVNLCFWNTEITEVELTREDIVSECGSTMEPQPQEMQKNNGAHLDWIAQNARVVTSHYPTF